MNLHERQTHQSSETCHPSLISPSMHSAVESLSVLQGVPVCTATCAQLHKRAEKITATLMERGGLNTGDNVVLLYPPGEHTPLPPLRLPFPLGELICFCSPHSLPSDTRRCRSDSCLLRLPVRRRHPRDRAAAPPSEPGGHPSHRPHDHRCESTQR